MKITALKRHKFSRHCSAPTLCNLGKETERYTGTYNKRQKEMTAPKVSKRKLNEPQRKVRLTLRGRYKKALQKTKL